VNVKYRKMKVNLPEEKRREREKSKDSYTCVAEAQEEKQS
jgi:hypothetical protein